LVRWASPSATLAAKLLPPAVPPTHVPRPRVEARLGDVWSRRVTVVVAGAGFGKTTLLAGWSGDVPSAWYSVTGDDAAVATLARGLVDALRLRIPGLPADIAGALAGSRGPDADADEAGVAAAFAAVLSEALQEELPRDFALVVDDLEELRDADAALHLVEALCRQAPPSLHLVLSSRSELPFRIDRLRGQGQVLELGSADLAFDEHEVAQLLATVGGDDDTAAALFKVSAGWPAAVRLAVEALRDVPPPERPHALEQMGRPGSSLFAYLAAEVFAREPPEVRDLVRVVARVERFTPELCEALGVEQAADTLASLARRGLFVEPRGRGVGWFSLNALVREYALASLPLAHDDEQRLLRTAASWLEENGHHEEALRALATAGDDEGTAELLRRQGAALLSSGAVEAVLRAVSRVPDEHRDAPLEQLAGEALQVRGDWEGALQRFERAARDVDRLEPGHAWRMGLIQHLRGRLDEALALYRRADLEQGEDRERALLLAWRASALWLRGAADECREDATRAFEVASRSGDHQALAAAHTVLALVAALEGDRGANDAHYLRALDYAQSANDVLQVIRVRTNRGSRHLEEGAYDEAIAELDLALRSADLTGFTSFRALALTNRGEARLHIGQLEEAIADLEDSRRLYERLGSRMVAYPLEKLGAVYRERGDWALARASYEEAIAHAEAGGDLQGLVPALAGLARVLAHEDPGEAERQAERAVSFGPGMAQVAALVAAGWAAVAQDRREDALRFAEEAASTAQGRRDRHGLAEALELRAFAIDDPEVTRVRLEEAASLWRELSSPLAEARAELAAASIAGDEERARAAEGRLRAGGVRSHGVLLARMAPRVQAQTLSIQSLGRFRVVSDGQAVPVSAWQSRKARDLLKMLVARRGRPVPRDELIESLWPDEDLEKTTHRLSVALSTVRSVLDPEKQFGPEWFVGADRNSVWLQTENVAVDVSRFLELAADALTRRGFGDPEAVTLLRRAEAAYEGDFLEEDVYEDWSTSLREEARAAYLDVARALAEDAAAEGDGDAAARYFMRVLEKDPYDERAHLGLVAALGRAGRHGEARRFFRAYCMRMEEIGVESAPFPTLQTA
jgi:ATP/maltotriose-dependent transcriptional regulator MalT/DNA-binding SARP family transcriptional activator